jgi:molybdopterin converting factor small subunit
MIKVKIKAYPVIKDEVTVEVDEGSKITDLIRKLAEMYPEFEDVFLDDRGNLDDEVVILYNKQPVKDVDRILEDGASLLFIPVVVGG